MRSLYQQNENEDHCGTQVGTGTTAVMALTILQLTRPAMLPTSLPATIQQKYMRKMKMEGDAPSLLDIAKVTLIDNEYQYYFD